MTPRASFFVPAIQDLRLEKSDRTPTVQGASKKTPSACFPLHTLNAVSNLDVSLAFNDRV